MLRNAKTYSRQVGLIILINNHAFRIHSLLFNHGIASPRLEHSVGVALGPRGGRYCHPALPCPARRAKQDTTDFRFDPVPSIISSRICKH